MNQETKYLKINNSIAPSSWLIGLENALIPYQNVISEHDSYYNLSEGSIDKSDCEPYTLSELSQKYHTEEQLIARELCIIAAENTLSRLGYYDLAGELKKWFPESFINKETPMPDSTDKVKEAFNTIVEFLKTKKIGNGQIIIYDTDNGFISNEDDTEAHYQGADEFIEAFEVFKPKTNYKVGDRILRKSTGTIYKIIYLGFNRAALLLEDRSHVAWGNSCDISSSEGELTEDDIRKHLVDFNFGEFEKL